MSRSFTKPATAHGQQIGYLRAAGMAIFNIARAGQWLRHVSSCRLNAYWRPFANPKGQPGPGFFAGTGFDTIIALDEFDQHLWLPVLDAIDRIAVTLRKSWACAPAHHGGPCSYLDASRHNDRRLFCENRSRPPMGKAAVLTAPGLRLCATIFAWTPAAARIGGWR